MPYQGGKKSMENKKAEYLKLLEAILLSPIPVTTNLALN